jgi:hypothetical protein
LEAIVIDKGRLSAKLMFISVLDDKSACNNIDSFFGTIDVMTIHDILISIVLLPELVFLAIMRMRLNRNAQKSRPKYLRHILLDVDEDVVQGFRIVFVPQVPPQPSSLNI